MGRPRLGGRAAFGQACARSVRQRGARSEPKTARGRRVVALDPETVAVLKAQAARQLAEQAATESCDDTGLVFTNREGQALHPWLSAASSAKP